MLKNRKNILLKVIMTQQCNRKCDGCDRSFDISQTYENLDKLIFLLESFTGYEEYEFNLEFFGGDPLLKFEMIQYFLLKINNNLGIKYTIYTDGVILDYEKFLFLKQNNININIFVDSDRYKFMLNKYFLKNENLTLGILVSPETINKAFYSYKDLYIFGYKNFRIIPDYFTYSRNQEKFDKLLTFVNFIEKNNSYFSMYSYLNKPHIDNKFILNTDGNFYSDIGLDFWYFIEFSELNNTLKDYINDKTKLLGIDNINSFNELLKLYNFKNLYNLSNKLLYKEKLYDIFQNLNLITYKYETNQ